MITVYGEKVKVEDLRKVQVVTPKRIENGQTAGTRWRGIQHGVLVESLIASMMQRDWKINDMQFALARGGADLAGAFDVTIPGLDAPEGQSYSLGLLTSNAMFRALRIVVGTNVAICNNGMATGEVALCRKHTTRLELFDEVNGALDRYIVQARKVKEFVSRLKSYRISNYMLNHLLCETGRSGILPWSAVGKVDKEFQDPTYPEHGKNAWGLYNAFTQIVKQASPIHQMDKMNKFRQLFPSVLLCDGEAA